MTKQKRWHWQCDGEMSPHGHRQHHWWPACHDGSFSLVTRRLETLLQLHWGWCHYSQHSLSLSLCHSARGRSRDKKPSIFTRWQKCCYWADLPAWFCPVIGPRGSGGPQDGLLLAGRVTWRDQWRCWAGISSEKYESQAALSWAGAAPGAVARPGPTARQSTYVVPLLEHYSQHNANWFKV